MRFGLLLANVTVNKVTAVGIARCIDNKTAIPVITTVR